ncbi:AbgT family transporter [Salibacterium halotolerans]|uniref:Aminobenzoyl-glutamate transport protein n=1 Tax=Salibacterium halotolerans TaxID=1884432 RepID=A0A1I5RGA3_9BACI|nr:AbgT family transporter [Salibacterium halotolerans]SFP57604.1 aminobenzoyl-glutamate transport protein [Salibacterium halotolerans]
MNDLKKKSVLQRMLDGVERIGNKLPHPITLFAILALLVVVLSAILAPLNIQVEDPSAEGEMLTVTNLLSGSGIEYIFTSMVDNFINFAPLGMVLATMIGIGMAEQSGLISAALRGFVLSIPKQLLTAGLVFAGIMSNIATDAGYVVLPPLGAMLFAALGRHPLAGLSAAFAGVSAGFSANLLISALDPLLGELTIQAASTIDPSYAEGMNIAMNYFFMVASTVLLTITGTFINDKIVEPRLGTYTGEVQNESASLEPAEKKGLLWASVSFVISAGLLSLLVLLPGAPLRGEDGDIVQQIVQSPFMSSLVVTILILFFIPGLVYGLITKSIKSDKDVANKLSETMASMGMFIVLAFAAGQFIAYFSETNLGTILGVKGSAFLDTIQLDGIPLIIAFILLSGFINLFIGSSSAKWAVMAPVFVPMLMNQGFSPELTQMAYRIADSTTNIITPLMSYFAIVIVFAQRYDKNMGIGSLISVMLPYSIGFFIIWTIMLIVWMLLGIDLGPGSPIYYDG